jgi:O-antigen biosynthesis protein
MNKLLISVIVASEGKRMHKLESCIQSILLNQYPNFEVIVVLQNPVHLQIEDKKLRTYIDNHKGVSYAKNIGISKAKGSIICFTDDDCLVSPQWTRTLSDLFIHYPEIDCITGPVKPYLQSKRNGLQCPSVFERKNIQIFTNPIQHQLIGSGNNIAFRKEQLISLGGFRIWFGPGSIAQSADDAEIILRFLGSGHRIMYFNSKNIVWHNRWLTQMDYRKQELIYLFSDTVCYTLYSFSYAFACTRIIKRWRINLWRYAHAIKMAVTGSGKEARESARYAFCESWSLIKGMIIGVGLKIITI